MTIGARRRPLVLVGAFLAAAALALTASATPAFATPPADTPSAPVGLTVGAGDASATLRWSPPVTSATPVSGYYITSPGTSLSVQTPVTTSYTVGNLTNGTSYTFLVAAVNDAGRGAFTRPSAAVIPDAPTVPAAPAQVSAVAGFESATVSWTAPDDGNSPITGYTVVADPDGQTVTVSGEQTSATLDWLTDGVDYTFTVVATNDVGDGPASDPSAAVTPDVTTPGAPSSITATSTGDGSVAVAWQSPDSDGGDSLIGYTVTAEPGGATATTDPSTTQTTITGLDDTTAYTFSVVASNSHGDGPGATSIATTPAVSVAAGTVPLSEDALNSLVGIDDQQTLTFQDAPAQVTGLQAGDVIVAGVSGNTPNGLLRTVTSVTTDGDTTVVQTGDASLDQALTDGGLSLDGSLRQDEVSTFRPQRRGVRLLPADVGGPPSMTIAINTNLYDDGHGGVVRLEGSEELTPHVSFSASLHCCVHIDSHFRASIEAKSELKLTAGLRKEIETEDGIELGSITFEPIEFTVGPVPVVIVPVLDLTLQASGEVSAGLTTSVSHTDEFGVDITTKDGTVDATPIDEHSTAFTPPTFYAGAELKAGPRARLTMYLYGVAGPYLQNTLYLLDFTADTSADPWWKLEISDSIGAGFHIKLLGHELADWSADPLYTYSLPIADSGGPFMGVTVTPDPVQVKPSHTTQLHATVANSRAQRVTWSVEPGGGTITSTGFYRAPATPGTYRVTATSPANGLKPETQGVATVQVTLAAPDAPTAVRATSNRYGQARISWTRPTTVAALTGYEISSDPYTGTTSVSATTRSTLLTGLQPHTTYTFQVRADNAAGAGPWSTPSAPVTISAYLPKGLGVLMAGSGDYGDTSANQWLAQTLTSAGYVVVPWGQDYLPTDLASFAQIWDVSTSGLSSYDDRRLSHFASIGRGVYLTGERPCCESVNVSDMAVVNPLLSSPVQIGGLGDPLYDHTAVDVNTAVAGGVAATPNALSTWYVDAPGGMSGVAPGHAFATAGGVALGAVWGPDDLGGSGRIVTLMDINWAEPGLSDATATPIAQNLAFYLSGLATPPAAAPGMARPAASAPKRFSPTMAGVNR